MNWRPVARKDVRDAVRSGGVLALTVTFVLLFLGVVVVSLQTGSRGLAALLSTAVGVVVFILPVIAFGVGYNAVLGERRARTLVLALSLPHSRRDFVVGKFVGRAAVLSVPVLAGLVLAGGMVVVAGPTDRVAGYLGFVVLTVLYGLGFLAVAFLLSMATASSRRATLGAVLAYFSLVLTWSGLVEFLVDALFRFRPTGATPDWAVFLKLLSPAVVYRFFLDWVQGVESGIATTADTPWFVTWWVGLGVLLAWVVVPVAVGYRQFERVEF